MTGGAGQAGGAEGAGEADQKLSEIISLARRTVGLHIIDTADLQRMRLEQYGGAKTEQEERLLAAREYLHCELKLRRLRIYFSLQSNSYCAFL